MRSRPVATLFVLLVASVAAASPAAAAPSASLSAQNATSDAELVAVYPDPVARGDPGEFVVVRFPRATNGTNWTLTDGKTVARLPNRTLSGTVALSTDPELRRGDDTVDATRYRSAPEASVWNASRGGWRPLGTTDKDPVRTNGGPATTFVLPDAPDRTVETLRQADDRLLLASYTLTSERVADALVAAHDRGATVRVLLDGSPVGGMADRQARILDRLAEAGVEVRLLTGPYARYTHHHPKYAVVDDRALVLTENFKPAGTGGMSSRGWGVVLEDAAAADSLASLHGADRSWRAAPQDVSVSSASVLVAPDNAADAVVERIDAADDRVLVQQMTIDGRDNRLLRAVLRAADRGVTVRVLLSDAHYVAAENTELADWLGRRADSEGWDLEARVDDPDGYEKIHAKGVVVDGTALVGSLNWGRTPQTENREVVVALEGGGAADYYASVFDDDWGGSEERPLPTALLGGAAVALAAAALVARGIEFGGREGTVGWQP
ncbi:phospholipase [Halobacteriales archaeon QS_1_68_44]|nr:MAG: phospholipase [Halobacteriales archaeon QS_1_68_44]